MRATTSSLSWKRVGVESVELVQQILDQAPRYRMNVDGITDSPNDGKDSLAAIPPNCSTDQKHFLIFYQDDSAIGVADLIQDFPEKGTAFLGLLLLREDHQGRGLGLKTYQLVEDLARNQLQCEKIRLAIVDSNPVQPYWEKMGFIPTGEIKPHEGVKRQSLKRVMEKTLASPIILRNAKSEDAASIAKVHVDTWRTAYAGIMPQEFLDSLNYQAREARWKQSILDQDGNCRMIAEHPKDGIIGILAGGKTRAPPMSGKMSHLES